MNMIEIGDRVKIKKDDWPTMNKALIDIGITQNTRNDFYAEKIYEVWKTSIYPNGKAVHLRKNTKDDGILWVYEYMVKKVGE